MKSKSFISGLIVGIIITASVSAFAVTNLNVTPNPYPVVVNGEEVSSDGYNINGSTYLGLTGIADGLNCNVKFEDKKIQITSDSQSTNQIDNTKEGGETNTMTTTTNETTTPNIDTDGSIIFDPYNELIKSDETATIDSINIYKVDNQKYVFFGDIDIIIKDTKLKLSLNHKTHIATISDLNSLETQDFPNYDTTKIRKITINQVSLGKYEDWFFTYEDWINEIVPFIKGR
jgi:hypothetical protein